MVVLLSPCDLDIAMRTLLRIPRWSDRVSFVRGTALKDEDLDRVNMIKASGCFILSARNVQQKKESVMPIYIGQSVIQTRSGSKNNSAILGSERLCSRCPPIRTGVLGRNKDARRTRRVGYLRG